MKVLMVEDDRWFSESLRNIMLSKTQFQIKTCASAEEAILLLDNFNPDVLLLDFTLGTKNALVLINELQSYIDTRDLPILILSLNAKQLDINDLHILGVRRILDKTNTTPEDVIDACLACEEEASVYV